VWLCRTFPNHDATYLLWLDARGLMPYLPKDTTPAAFFMDKVTPLTCRLIICMQGVG
jgi:hypothetical protein